MLYVADFEVAKSYRPAGTLVYNSASDRIRPVRPTDVHIQAAYFFTGLNLDCLGLCAVGDSRIEGLLEVTAPFNAPAFYKQVMLIVRIAGQPANIYTDRNPVAARAYASHPKGPIVIGSLVSAAQKDWICRIRQADRPNQVYRLVSDREAVLIDNSA